MPRLSSRPLIIWLVSAMVALNGLLSLRDGVALVSVGAGFYVEGALSLVLGLFMLHRAWGLWNMQRVAYAVTLVLIGVRAVVVALATLTAPSEIVAWIDVAVLVLAFFLLLLAHNRSDVT